MSPGPYKKGRRFPETRWSLVKRAADHECLEEGEAITELLEMYRPALRAFLVDTRRVPHDLVDDLIHDFIEAKILTLKLPRRAEPSRGRFRNLLLKSLTHFVASKMQRKYGTRPGIEHLDIELMKNEIPAKPDIDQFNQVWVRQVLHDALQLMEAECARQQREDLWVIFKLRTVDPMLEDREPASYEQIIKQLEIHTPRQAMNLLATAKRSFSRNLRTAIGRYVEGEKAVEEEIDDLREIVGR